jgi:hypothetical protein
MKKLYNVCVKTYLVIEADNEKDIINDTLDAIVDHLTYNKSDILYTEMISVDHIPSSWSEDCFAYGKNCFNQNCKRLTIGQILENKQKENIENRK